MPTPVGSWRKACSGGQNCTAEISRSFDIGSSDSESWSREVTASLEGKINAGVNVKAATASKEITIGLSGTTAEAGEIVKNRSSGYSETCSTQIDMQKYDIDSLWQWTVAAEIEGEQVSIKTCQVACNLPAPIPLFCPEIWLR